LTSAEARDGFLHIDESLSDPRARRAFDISSVSVGERRVEVSERTIHRRPFANLIAFSRADVHQDQILVIAPLAGAFPVLLRDLVIDLLWRGSVVAIADWFDARYLPEAAGRFGLEEEISYVAELIRMLGPELHVIGVCQAVVPALAATALLAANEPEMAPRSLVLIGGPVDPLANPTGVVERLRSHSLKWFRQNIIEAVPPGWPGEGRLVYPKTIQLASFTGYLARHFAAGRELYWKFLADDGEDPRHFPFSALATTMMDLPAEHVLENIRCIFHDRELARRNMHFAGDKIDLDAISATALMTVEGAEDDIAAPGQTRAAHALCRSIPSTRRRHLLVDACGHFSLFHGRICRTHVVPKIIGFINREARA
jgi:poly(3-hydroxybutyrate) depolymerase